MNLGVAVLFVVFGLSLLGLFEIRLPSFLLDASSKAEGRGGLVGVVFMAMTLTITSFTCTFVCEKSFAPNSRRGGERTGGNADDAVTASATARCGLGKRPTCQSAMYGLEKRISEPVCTFVALITKRGRSGSSCSVVSPKRCSL